MLSISRKSRKFFFVILHGFGPIHKIVEIYRVVNGLLVKEVHVVSLVNSHCQLNMLGLHLHSF